MKTGRRGFGGLRPKLGRSEDGALVVLLVVDVVLAVARLLPKRLYRLLLTSALLVVDGVEEEAGADVAGWKRFRKRYGDAAWGVASSTTAGGGAWVRVRVKLGEKPPLPKGRSAAEFDVDGRRFSFCKEREREMDYLVSNVGNSCSCPRPLWRRFRYSFTCFCLEAIAATRSQRWLLWSYVIVVAASWETVTVSTWLSNPSHSHTCTYTYTLHTIAAVRLSIVLRANSSQPAPLPPPASPLLLALPFYIE